MEAFLREMLPRVLPEECVFQVHSFQGKADLLGKLESRLRGYATWLPDDWRIVIVVDCDADDCYALKQRLEEIADSAGLRTRSQAGPSSWQLVNRIAIEELEAWYFGDWKAVQSAYPRVSQTVTERKAFRNPDAILGGTWEAFERILKRYGYFKTGLRKVEAARAIGAHLNPSRSRSHSFLKFYEAVTEATT
jgi:hypothetical protein